MAHKQRSRKLELYGEKLSSPVTNSAPLQILSYSSSYLNINGNGFCFKISMDPTAMILIKLENLEGGGEYINSELDTQSFVSSISLSFECKAFSIP